MLNVTYAADKQLLYPLLGRSLIEYIIEGCACLKSSKPRTIEFDINFLLVTFSQVLIFDRVRIDKDLCAFFFVGL